MSSEFIAGSPSRASVTARLASPVYGTPVTGIAPQGRRQSKSRRDSLNAPLAGAAAISTSIPGQSSLSQALRGAPRSFSPRSVVPEDTQSLLHKPSVQQLGRSPRGTEDIDILKRHLVPEASGSLRGKDSVPSGSDGEEFSSLQLQGGDTTRHIYRYAEKREREREGRPRRSASVGPIARDDDDKESVSGVMVPGGFRRDHLRRMGASPAPSSVRPVVDTEAQSRPQPQFLTNNFIEFLTLYGHFAGEELDEDDEVLGPDEYFFSDADGDRATETSTLLPKKKRIRKQREAGKGGPIGAALLLLKSFVGTGVLFLPRAFLNGGMVFANVVLLLIAVLSYYCFILLVSTRLKVHASFGDMGGQIYGDYFKGLINSSLVISQIGFSSAYIVFVAENLQAFVLAVTRCAQSVSVAWLIILQMAIFLPLSLYRNINHIQKLALLADIFICLGLVYVYYYDIATLINAGGIADIVSFNSKDWTLFIGTAIFTFEGIGLVIPIQSGMRQPERFPSVLAVVMIIITVIFLSAGALSYAAYGSATETVILLNMPQDSALVNAVQLIYSLAILLSTPLQIYPAIEITSQQLFSRTGKYNPYVKWKKNLFRFAVVALCGLIAYAGAGDLDKFVALVGSFACIPLVYIYPPLMHYRVVATRQWQRVVDLLLVVFGFGIMVYTTALTVNSWVEGSSQPRSPGYCDGR
ncbi:transmembrane domain transport protein [Piedraia hortae CBS 480.64]|uniref:Transmembrane domain transport protein n=1 Tax=Piedraia hortae CBS 480.64 TaxID=1314780 RepID=A0A6A7BPV8_9PEZI|nr:transmembrane domain transport protein [Piedraia hortae CBS 480.64]